MTSFTKSPWTDVDINFIRGKKPSSHKTKVIHLLLLVTGFVSCDETSTTQSDVTSAQTSIQYSVDFAVDVTGPAKNETEIKSWLIYLLTEQLEEIEEEQKELLNDVLSNSPPLLQTGSANCPVTLQNTIASTITLQSSSTTAATTLQNNNTATTSTLQNNTAEKKINAEKNGEKRITNSNNTRLIQLANRSTKSNHLFERMEVSCANKTEIRKTNCLVVLELSQNVSPCQILQSICAANQSSSDIHAIGKRVNILSPLNNSCGCDHVERNVCIYTQKSVNSTCEASAFVAPPCGADNNKNCTCTSYCKGTDAYYTFEISLQDPQMELSYPLSLISQLNQSCSPVTNVSCSSSTIIYEYKNAYVDCGQVGAKPGSCSVILQLAEEVPICNVSAAITTIFQSEKNITFDGRTTRAAVCGHPKSNENLLDSQFTWMNTTLQHAEFCTSQEGSRPQFFTQNCQSGKHVVVQLNEQCDPIASTADSQNVATTQANSFSSNTAPSPDVTVVSPNDTESQADALLELSANVSRLNSSQLDQIVSQLEDLLSGPNISLALANTIVHIFSNLLNASAETLGNSYNRMIRIVDAVGLKVVLEEETETLLSPSLAVSVKAVDGSNFEQVVFSISDPSNAQVRDAPRFRRSVRNNSSIPQGSITLPASLTQNLSTEEQEMAFRVHFNFYQKSTVFQDISLGSRRLNSGILGASLANLTLTGLQDQVVISLRNLEPIPANYVATCVFWDFGFNNGSGGWNTNGCHVQNSTDDVTVCGCNHLTSFSILLDLARQPLTSRVQATILTFITYIGCGISAIFLALTLLTYLAFDKLRKDIASKILIQLCTALLMLNLIFLLDAWLALYPAAVGLCISTAWFLHYFLLASFTWMGLEGLHMYLAIVKVLNTQVRRYILWFSLAGWGVPALVVVVVIAVDKDNYGLVSYGRFSDGTSDDFCWLRNDVAFYVAVVAYFCVVFLFNFVMFVVVLVQLHKIKRQNPHNSKHRSTGQDVRSVVGITILLGLTWGFAFFAWGPVNLPFMYLFAICNAFQGFFIFVFHCAVKDAVRRQWQTYLCFGKIRLVENSDWGPTATQKTSKKASGNRGTSFPSSATSEFNSSSSSSSFFNHNMDQARENLFPSGSDQ